jgi:predicted DNA-binding transcriptional regulator AlpA
MTNTTHHGQPVNKVDNPGPQKFVRLNDLRRDGYLPWGRSRIYDLIKQGTLPPPIRFGARLTGYTLQQITEIQQKLMSPATGS